VAYPKITVKKHEPLEYEAIVAVLPEVTWSKDIKKLSVAKKAAKVEAKEIEEVLSNLKTRSTKWNDVERKAKKGDRTEVDFDGYDLEGNALPGTSSKNHPVILGEGSLIPGFEDEVIGMEKDQEKTFEITFPKDYHSDEFKGKKVKFTVTLRRIEEAEEPKMDDAFAAEITGGNRKTMAELKEEIKEELGKQKEKEEEARLENEFLKELATFVKADLPEVLIEREMELMQSRIKQDLEKRKQNWEDYLAELEKEGKDIKKELHKPATEQLLIRLGLEELYKQEPVEISSDELEAGIRDMVAFYPPHFAPMVEERYKEGSQDREMLKNQLRLRKLVAKHTK
jgi:trigger factor